MKNITINGESFFLKEISKKGDMTKHGDMIEFAIYDKNGEFETTTSIYRELHHSCKEKGFKIKSGEVFNDIDDAIFRAVLNATDYNPRRDYI